MNTLRRLVPCLVLGLTMAIGGAGLAQQAAQIAGDKKESVCCASCACCGDACALMKKEAKNHATTCEKHEGCCGASCELKDSVKKNQVASARHECCADSASKKSGTMKNKAVAGAHECCRGDSRTVSDQAKMTASTMKDGSCACCCAGSCKMENPTTKGGQ